MENDVVGVIFGPEFTCLHKKMEKRFEFDCTLGIRRHNLLAKKHLRTKITFSSIV